MLRFCLVIVLTLLVTNVGAQTRIHHYAPNSGGQFGRAVAGLGDIDGDGTPDFIVGAPLHHSLSQSATVGAAFVYSGLDGQILLSWEGSPTHFGFGRAVAGVGDVDGDGLPDLAIGANDRVVIFSGLNGGLIHDLVGPGLGHAISYAGDVDGDGRNDILLGLPSINAGAGPNSGAALLVSGSTGGYIGSWAGGSRDARLGAAVSHTGTALLLGASGGRNSSGSPTGTLRVINKSDLSQRFQISGSVAGSAFAASLDGIGDIDGDGFEEIAVGAPNEGLLTPNVARGSVAVYSEATGAMIHHWFGLQGGDRLGSAVSGLGDLNGDGTPDILVSSMLSAPGAPPSGRVRVFSGADAATLDDRSGSPGDSFGVGLAELGDLNQDGVPDWIAGSWGAPTLLPTQVTVYGQASVFSGATLATAALSNLGGGCGSGSAPTLSLSGAPVLGMTRIIATNGFPPNSSGFLFAEFSAPVLQPLGSSSCVLALDLTRFSSWVPVPITHDTSGSWSLFFPVSSGTFLAGLPVTLQAAVFNFSSPLGIELSNALSLVYGY